MYCLTIYRHVRVEELKKLGNRLGSIDASGKVRIRTRTKHLIKFFFWKEKAEMISNRINVHLSPQLRHLSEGAYD